MNNSSSANSAHTAQFRGERLRELREAQDLDIESLAKRLALSPAQLRQLESNQSSLFYSDAIRLATARKVSEFLGETLVLEPDLVLLASMAADSDRELVGTQAREPVPVPPPRRVVVREQRFALSGWSVALCGVALTFAVLLGSQVLAPSPSFSPGVAESLAPVVPVAPADLVAPVVMPVVDAPAELATASTVGAVLPRSPALVKTVEASPACILSSGPEATFIPAKAAKDPAQIFVQGSPGHVVCVKDSRGQVWRHEFANSKGRIFSGEAPWLVESAQLTELQVYFQGTRARPTTSGATRMRLIAAEPT